MFEYVIQENTAGMRLDKVLRKHLKAASDPFIYKMLRKKNITLNSKKAEGNEITASGDVIRFWFSDETYEKMRGEEKKTESFAPPENFPEIRILYEDQDVMLFVKPSGVLSQKSFDGSYSVNEWLVDHAVRIGMLSGSEFEMFRPSIVNRLDQNTGGIIAAGLSLKGLKVLSELFRERTLCKYYYAIVVGRVKEGATLKSYLVKDEKKNEVWLYKEPVKGSKEIRTEFWPVRYDERQDLTLVKVHLLTGRSHQIRAHMNLIRHPILGDRKYGIPEVNLKFRKCGMCLLSYRIEFPECDLPGISGKTFEIPVPANWPVRPDAEKCDD